MQATRDPLACDTEALNSLLRGEMAAVETYTLALVRFGDETLITELQKIRDDHSRAVRELRDHIVRFGGEPTEGAGPWSEFTAAVTRTATEVGPDAILAALREGEEHGIRECQAVLENQDIHPDCQRTICAGLVAACRKHVEELNHLMAAVKA